MAGPMRVRVGVLGATPIDVQLSATATCHELVEKAINIENKNGAEIDLKHVSKCLLYVARKSMFAESDQTLANAGVRNNDYVKVVLQRDAGQIRLFKGASWNLIPTYKQAHSTGRIFKVDFTEPLFRLIPRMAAALKIKRSGKDEYVLRPAVQRLTPEGEKSDGELEILNFLNANLSLREQDIPSMTTIMVVPLACFVERPLFDYKNPSVEGWMTKTSKKEKSKKATAKKKRWCVLQDGMLAYFASDKKPASGAKGVVGVDYMTVSLTDNTLVLEKNSVSWSSRALAFEFTPENDKDVAKWERSLTCLAANGAPFRTFGLSLQALEERSKDAVIPFVVEATIEHLRKTGALKTEKIFSNSGNIQLIELWRDMFDRGRAEEVVAAFEKSDADSVAAFFKLFLRELPEPILTFSAYDAFVLAGSSNDVTSLIALVKALPAPNQRVLRELLSLISETEKHSSQNHMDREALCKIFVPNVLRKKTQDRATMLGDVQRLVDALGALVTNRKQLQYRKARLIRKTSRLVSKDGVSLETGQQRSRGLTLSAAMLAPPPTLIAPPALKEGKKDDSRDDADSNADNDDDDFDDDSANLTSSGAMLLSPPPVMNLPPPVLDDSVALAALPPVLDVTAELPPADD